MRNEQELLLASFSGEFGDVEMPLLSQDFDILEVLDEVFRSNPDVFDVPSASSLEIHGVGKLFPEVLDIFRFQGKVRSEDSQKSIELSFVDGFRGKDFAEQYLAFENRPYNDSFAESVRRLRGYLDQYVSVDGHEFVIVDSQNGQGAIPFVASQRTFSKVLGSATWHSLEQIRSSQEAKNTPWLQRGKELVRSKLGVVKLGTRNFYFSQWSSGKDANYNVYLDDAARSVSEAIQCWIEDIHEGGSDWPGGKGEHNDFFRHPAFWLALRECLCFGGTTSKEFKFRTFDTELGPVSRDALFALKFDVSETDLCEVADALHDAGLFPGHA